jgi:hypothetical protein
MKPAVSSKKFPTRKTEVEAAIARAPGKDRPLTVREDDALKQWFATQSKAKRRVAREA